MTAKWDVIGVLERGGVHYVRHGSNVKRGNVNIKCPFCTDDKSEHMGINLKTGYWGCWRDSDHRGKHPYRLLNKLLGMDRKAVDAVCGQSDTTTLRLEDMVEAANRLVKVGSQHDDGDDLLEMDSPLCITSPRQLMARVMALKEVRDNVKICPLGKRISRSTVKSLTGTYGWFTYGWFFSFLATRLHLQVDPTGNNNSHIPSAFYPDRTNINYLARACNTFNLHMCIPKLGEGPGYYRNASHLDKWAYRLVFPVTINGRTVNLSGRSINGIKNKTKYVTLSTNVPGVIRSSDILLNFDSVMETGGDILFVTEGPFDALNMDVFGFNYGARATCIFGKVVSDAQITLLSQLAPRFKKIVIMLDNDALAGTIKACGQLAHLGAIATHIPNDAKDPGTLLPPQIVRLVQDLRQWL